MYDRNDGDPSACLPKTRCWTTCSLLADEQRGLFLADLLGQQQCQLDECCGSEDRGNLPAYRESYTRYLIYDRILFVNRFKNQ